MTAGMEVVPSEVETPPSRSDFRSLLGHSAVYAAARVALSALDLLFLPLYTRVLSPSEFGLIAVGSSVLAILAILFSFGFDGALLRLYYSATAGSVDQRRVVGGTLAGMVISGLVGTAVLLLAGSAPFGDLLNGVSPRFFRLLVLTAVLNLLPTFWLQLLQLQQRPAAYLASSVAYAFVRGTTVVLAVVLLRRGADGWVEAYLATTIIAAAAAIVALRPQVAGRGALRALRDAIPFGVPLLVHHVASWLSVSAGRLLLNALVPLAAVGIYQVAFGIGQGIGLITTAVNFAYAPAFMATAERSPSEAGVRFGRFANVYISALFLVAVLVALFREPLVRLVAAHQYAAAAPILPIVLATFVLQGIYFVLVNPIFFRRTSVRLLPFITVGGAAVGLIGLRVLVPRLGIAGAAWAALGSNLAVAAVAFPLSQRSLRLAYDLRRLGLGAVAGAAIVLTSYAVSPHVGSARGSMVVNVLLVGLYLLLLRQLLDLSVARLRGLLASVGADGP
jgi:O-antigen/teichoic acid export membrane protein